MKAMRDVLTHVHPLCSALYFVGAVGFTMIFMHPVMLGISILGCVLYSVLLKGARALRFMLVCLLPMVAFVALINPLFNHRGVTVLFYLRGGSPITMEAVIYGLASGVMLAAAVTWFSCCNVVMTSDKIVYLIGRGLPNVALLVSMVLRLSEKLSLQFKAVLNAQKCIGREVSSRGFMKRIRGAADVVSIIVSWALEDSVQTADSMKSRGYGLPGRTVFAPYRFTLMDKSLLGAQLLAFAVMAYGVLGGHTVFEYFPKISFAGVEWQTLMVWIIYYLYILLPVILMIGGELRWRYLQSKI